MFFLKNMFVIIECFRFFLYMKLDLFLYLVFCIVFLKCMEVRCCVDIYLVVRKFEVFIDIDFCFYIMFVGIEDYKMDINF